MDLDSMPREQVAMLMAILFIASIPVVMFVWWLIKKIIQSGWSVELSALFSRWGNMVRLSHAAEIEKLRKQVAQHERWIELNHSNGGLFDGGTQPADYDDLKMRVKLIEDTLNDVLADFVSSPSPRMAPPPPACPPDAHGWPQDANQAAGRQADRQRRDAVVRSLISQGLKRDDILKVVKEAGWGMDKARLSELMQERRDSELIEQEA